MNTAPNQELKSLHMGEMMYMRERVLWQSKLGLKDPPRLTDIPQLAEDLRKTWPRDNFCGMKIVQNDAVPKDEVVAIGIDPGAGDEVVIVTHRHVFYRCVKCKRFGYANTPCVKCGGATSGQPI